MPIRVVERTGKRLASWTGGSSCGGFLWRAPSDDFQRDIHSVNDQVAPASRLGPAPPLVEPKPIGLILAVEVGRRLGVRPPAYRRPGPHGAKQARMDVGRAAPGRPAAPVVA